MKVKSIIAASALLAATVASAAVTTPITLTNIGTNYSGTFAGNASTNVFSLDFSGIPNGTNMFNASITANYTLGSGYNISSVMFDDVAIAPFVDFNSPGLGVDVVQYTVSGLSIAVPHTITVRGNALGTSTVGFTGSVGLSNTPFPTVTAAVPEPETYGMMLVGLGLMGAVARRRAKSNAA